MHHQINNNIKMTAPEIENFPVITDTENGYVIMSYSKGK